MKAMNELRIPVPSFKISGGENAGCGSKLPLPSETSDGQMND